MKRRPRDVSGIPERLAWFTPADWPGAGWDAKFAAWKAAQEAHAAEHGWPGGPLDMFYRRMLIKARYLGKPAELPVTDHFGLPPERPRPGRIARD